MKTHAAIFALLLLAAPAWANWHNWNPQGSTNEGGMLNEVLSRSTRGQYFRQKYASDLATCCHECTHDINGRASNAMGPDFEAFYMGGGKIYVLREPRTTIKTVAQRVAPQYRDQTYFALYLVQQPNSQPIVDQMPLYLMDEWSASINGAEAAIQLDVNDTGDLQMANQFCHYADCLVATIQQVDPGYSDMAALVEFVRWQKKRVENMNTGKRSPFVPRTQPAIEALPYRNNAMAAKQTKAQFAQGCCIDGQCYQPQQQPQYRIQTQPPKQSIDPGSLTEQLKQQWLTYITNTVNTTIENKLEASQCNCDLTGYMTIEAHNSAMAALRAEINTAINVAIASKIEEMGLAGGKGDKGDVGPQGPAGPAAEVNIQAIVSQVLAELKKQQATQPPNAPSSPNVDEITAEVMARLQPVYIRVKDARGPAYSTDYQKIQWGTTPQYVTLPFGPRNE